MRNHGDPIDDYLELAELSRNDFNVGTEARS